MSRTPSYRMTPDLSAACANFRRDRRARPECRDAHRSCAIRRYDRLARRRKRATDSGRANAVAEPVGFVRVARRADAGLLRKSAVGSFERLAEAERSTEERRGGKEGRRK